MSNRPSHRPAHTRRGGPPWGLLVESGDPVLAISDHAAFRDSGFEVMLCAGPRHDASECPLVRGEQCPYVDAADVVLFDTRYGTGRSEVLDALQAANPGLPVVARGTDRNVRDCGSRMIPRSTSVAGQVSALRRAVLAP